MTDYGLSVVTARIRFARNINGYMFPSRLSADKAKEIIDKTYSFCRRFADFSLNKMNESSDVFNESLKERYIISEQLKNRKSVGAVAYCEKFDVSVMINEEDHIREQCIVKGADLFAAYKVLKPLDSWLDKNLRFSKNDKYGFLTACPTNLGTGMRASVMVFLPFLSRENLINSLFERASSSGLTIRGIFGEGSRAQSYLYQISNECTLARSDESILKTVGEFVEFSVLAEKEKRDSVFSDNRIKIEDEVYRAFAILSSCRLLPYAEFSSLMASVKIGVELGLLKTIDKFALDDLLVTARPATLLSRFDSKSGVLEENQLRAQYISQYITKTVVFS